MNSPEPEKLKHGCKAEYGNLRLLVEQYEDSVKIAISDMSSNRTIWEGDAPTIDLAKEKAIIEATKHCGDNPLTGSLGLPVWEAHKDPFSNL
jgi:hypothetical protein